jgi:putative flippase GtrA
MINKAWQNDRVRYILIGLYNTVFGYSVFALIWLLWGKLLHYLIILLLSHIFSVINAFFGYRILVFRKKGDLWLDFLRFNLVYIGAFVFNILALPVLVEGFNMHPLFAQALLVIVTVISSYLLHKRFSFKLSKSEGNLISK